MIGLPIVNSSDHWCGKDRNEDDEGKERKGTEKAISERSQQKGTNRRGMEGEERTEQTFRDKEILKEFILQ